MTTQATSSATESIPERFIGQVKWFNNKTGYGFITAISGENKGKDIFVHQTTIRVAQSQYKYLVEGEYVEFQLSNSTTGNHEFQAVDVTGIQEGSLMCEKRNLRQPTDRRTYDQDRDQVQERDPSQDRRQYQTRRPADQTRRPPPPRRSQNQGRQAKAAPVTADE
jgi:cold shock CspA family protein